MNETTQSRLDMFGSWCALLYLIGVFGGWGIVAGFFPPATPPSFDATQIAALYQADYTRIRIGMLILMFAALAFIPFAATAASLIARVEGRVGMLTFSFLLGAAGNMVLTFYPAIWWLVAAFRPDRSPDLTYLMNDAGWLQFLGGISIYLAMPLTITATSLLDDDTEPVFPRWCGFVNAWLAVLMIPDQLLFFFYRGPFAWNGLFGLWLPAVVFTGFFVVNFFAMRTAILRLRRPSVGY